MIVQSTLDFLADLHKNNNREWYHANKNRFKDAFINFEDLIAMLLHTISGFDDLIIGTEPKECISQIYRDIRFSKDKTPYKSWFGASMKPGGRRGIGSGYYIHISSKLVYISGGIWHPSQDTLSAIRDYIIACPNKFENVALNKSFQQTFGELGGEKLKISPRGIPKNHPQIKWLRHKDFIVSLQFNPQDILSEKFITNAGKGYEKMLPLNQFISKEIY